MVCAPRMPNSKGTGVSLLVTLELGDMVKCVPHTLRGEITLSLFPRSLCLHRTSFPEKVSDAHGHIAQRMSPAVSSMG